MNSRSILRAEAKKLYKEQIKGVPKKQRITFAVFFKNYKAVKSDKINDVQQFDIDAKEDFNFDNIINVNEISDDGLESSQTIIKDVNQE